MARGQENKLHTIPELEAAGEPKENLWARRPGHFSRPVSMPVLTLSIMLEQRKEVWPWQTGGRRRGMELSIKALLGE